MALSLGGLGASNFRIIDRTKAVLLFQFAILLVMVSVSALSSTSMCLNK